MKFQPRTQALILDAEKMAADLRVISGRSHRLPGDAYTPAREYFVRNTVPATLSELYKQVKHLIPGGRAKYWNQVNKACGEWYRLDGRGTVARNWEEMSVAYDRVLEAVYAADDHQDDE